jgi:hypothetical protein
LKVTASLIEEIDAAGPSIEAESWSDLHVNINK